MHGPATSQSDTAVELHGIHKRFDTLTAVHPLDLTVETGSFTTLLGPSGCGKTTILRIIAGLLAPTGGRVLVRGRDVTGLPVHKRNLGVVFQNYALFPHKSVFDNVAFGLRYRRVDKATMRQRVLAMLELVQLGEAAQRYPHQLSGGQQQRVALARALVIEPDVLLLDEPLSALDAKLREDMRIELKSVQRRLGVTTVFVTHDQAEALAMSDRIVLLNGGRMEQAGAPAEVYDSPATLFAAQFLGAANVLPARLVERTADRLAVDAEGLGRVLVDPRRVKDADLAGPISLVLRAERVRLEQGPTTDATGREPPENVFSGRIDVVDYQGQIARYFIDLGGRTVQAIEAIQTRPFAQGAQVTFRIDPKDCVLLASSQGGQP